ncbi:MAG: NADH-quinone oxidoreductase subunit NuoH [Planctomycetota bacterium]
MPEFIRQFITPQLFVSVHVMVIVVHVILLTVAYLIYLERKISAYIQDRLGPNRVGFDFGIPQLSFLKGCLGLGQPLADGIKFLIKEDYRPTKVDAVLFTLAPVLIIIPALIGFIIIPWGGRWDMPVFDLPLIGEIGGEIVHIAGANVNVGLIYLLAVASLGVYGVTLGGWASNSKFSFIGGLRATAQMISYEIPLGLSLLAVVVVCGTWSPEGIIRHQVEGGWMILAQPIAAVLFFMAILAEANRAPFDNAEAEQELVGGYHTEYSSMRFALFFLAEYAHMFTSCAFFSVLFLGGYHLPFIDFGLTSPDNLTVWGVLAKFGVIFAKIVLLICFMMVIRWTLPRLRYDQVMMLGWQSLIPISLTVVVATSVMVYLGYTSMPALLVVNLVIGAGVLLVQNTLPHSTRNRRIALYGSRYSAPEGDDILTAPTDPMAREDRPVQGTVPMAT